MVSILVAHLPLGTYLHTHNTSTVDQALFSGTQIKSIIQLSNFQQSPANFALLQKREDGRYRIMDIQVLNKEWPIKKHRPQKSLPGKCGCMIVYSRISSFYASHLEQKYNILMQN
jgi:hypothetical protein